MRHSNAHPNEHSNASDSNASDHPASAPRTTPRTRARGTATAQHSRASTRSTSKKVATTRENDLRASGDSAPVAGFGEPRWPGDSRPPFAAGNQLAAGNTSRLVHGAYSDRSIAERAQLVHDRLLEVCPWLAAPHFAPSVQRYAQATAREQLANDGLKSVAKLSPRLLEAATAAARLAWQMGDALGLTPAGHARLKILVAGGEHAELSVVEAVKRRGQQAMAERDASGTGSGAVAAQDAADELDGTGGPGEGHDV